MITRIVKIDGDEFCCSSDGGNRRRAEYWGKSTDTKPKQGVHNADIFYEMDTKKVFCFCEESGDWLEQ